MLYEKVAEQIESFISRGVFEPGERLPSVRRLARQLRVSVNTVREAYSLLEHRRTVAARSGSGHFVTYFPCQSESEGTADFVQISPKKVTVDEITYRICASMGQPDLVNLSGVAPRSTLLPTRRIADLHARALRKNPEANLAYDTSPGRYSLRQSIARRLLDAGCIVGADEITVTPGCFFAVTISLLAVCRPGDTVAIETPVVFSLLQLLESLSLKIVEIPSSQHTGMNLDALEQTLRRHSVAACVVVPNFSNPQGSLMPDENKERLVRLAEEHEFSIIEDDVYGDLYFGADRPRVLRSFDQTGSVIHCSSFSKTAAPGYRIGWVLGGKFTERIRRIKAATSIATSSVSEIGIEEFLERGGFDRTLRVARRAYERSASQVRDSILKHLPKGTRVSQPKGGIMLWVELPEMIDSVRLYNACLANGVSIAPGAIFSSRGQYRNYLRVPSAEFCDRIERALQLVGQLARDLQREGERTVL